MKLKQKWYSGIFGLLLLALISPSASFACSFVSETKAPSSEDLYYEFSEKYDRADEIHQVRVIAKEDHEYTFAIIRSFKSTNNLSGQVSYRSMNSCGSGYQIGQSVIIFAGWSEGRLSIPFYQFLPSDHPLYEPLLARLAEPQSKRANHRLRI